jgi:hypothetical protein
VPRAIQLRAEHDERLRRQRLRIAAGMATMSAESPFLRPSNGGNTAWVTTTSNAITRATASGGIAVDVTLEASTWRSGFIAAATDRQLAAIRATTPADDAEPMHKSGSVIAFIPAPNGAGRMAVGFLPRGTSEWDKS